jgi:GH25 family lysozyme M1 (1,4-beta-N-acetylmuramidase)
MKSTTALIFLASGLAVSATPAEKRTNPKGIDVSHYQGTINWKTVAANGISFAFIKATEGTCMSYFALYLFRLTGEWTAYQDPEFSANYDGATSAGLIRGSYHFAHPDESSGATQATYFIAHGGGWSGDGITLPGSLDIECMCPLLLCLM